MGEKIALFLAPRLIHWITRLIVMSCRIRVRYGESADWSPRVKSQGPGGRIYACWHGQLLLCTYLWRDSGVHAMVSRSKDGELLARTLGRWGYASLRGSSSRGGAAVYREALGVLKARGSLAIAPDGPRGPRHSINPGAVHLAMRSGSEIIPMAARATRTVKLNSWDQFEIPLPFSVIETVVGAPLRFPDTRDEAGVKDYEAGLKRTLDELSESVGLQPIRTST